MADLEGIRIADPESSYKDLSDGTHVKQLTTSGRTFKVGVSFLSVSGLVLFLIVANPGLSHRLHGADAAGPSSFIGVPYSLRVRAPATGMPKAMFLPKGRSMGNAYGLDSFQQQGAQSQLPYRSRVGNFAPPLQGFWDNFGRDPGYYAAKTYEQGEEADYKSKSKGGWIPCTITRVGEEGIQIDVKPGVWIDDKEQKSQMRRKIQRDR